MRQNPGVMIETLQRLLPILAQAPNVNMFALFEELVSGLGLPQSLIIPEDMARQGMAAAQAQQQQAELQRAQGGAAVKNQPTAEDQTPPNRSVAKARAAGDTAGLPAELLQQIQGLATQQGQSPPQG
jgi:hypothetical protein